VHQGLDIVGNYSESLFLSIPKAMLPFFPGTKNDAQMCPGSERGEHDHHHCGRLCPGRRKSSRNGGGAQFIHGTDHCIDQIAQMVPVLAWGLLTRVSLDVGVDSPLCDVHEDPDDVLQSVRPRGRAVPS
jgi:hypothetical protein